MSKHGVKSRYLHHLIQGTQLVEVSCSYQEVDEVTLTLNYLLNQAVGTAGIHEISGFI